MPASRASKKPSGNERQERKDAVSGREDGNHEMGDKLEGRKAKRKGDHLSFGRRPQCVIEQRKSCSSCRLTNFATLPTAIVEVTRTRWHRQYAVDLATKKVYQGKERDCVAEQLEKTWRQWCHTSI